ncbi:ribosomal-processing cysteine protease Prp [Enterococcus nangangensis]|uniref:ribosomal-processing cysteine protease Prp n=1 Tax=Enterococcus nangangensis TaxID=2559926 RepID=UPI0010F77351|nr:ribosomal-processing cysteine protease Prp [Enterococcus nangangensis]
MIRGTFQRDEEGHISQFVLTGHADSAPYGSDIVCAAVSALAISTVNGIEALAGFEPAVVMDNDQGGHLAMTLADDMNGEQLTISQILLENLLLGLQSVASENAEYLEIKTINQ